MAYQNVETPRFYVCILSYLKSMGNLKVAIDSTTNEPSTANFISDEDLINLIGINPSDAILLDRNPDNATITGNNNNYDVLRWQIKSGAWFSHIMPNDKNFQMILGHNLASAEGRYYVQAGGTGDVWDTVANNHFINTNPPIYDGFSVRLDDNADDLLSDKVQFRIETVDNDALNYVEQLKIGSLLYGTYFEMPHSPDLSLTMTREMDGVKRVRTRGGVDLVKHQYTKSPKWGDLAPWELYDPTTAMPNQALSRVGRRTWDLSFSYLQDSDVFPDTSSLTNYGTSGYSDGDDITENTLLEDNSFFSQVIHKTNGGQLPFIFQPDKDYPEFAICKFDMNSFQFEQVANGVYNIKLKIREVW